MRIIHPSGTSTTRSNGKIMELAAYRSFLANQQDAPSHSQMQERDHTPSADTSLPWLLEICASVATVTMTLAFTWEILAH